MATSTHEVTSQDVLAGAVGVAAGTSPTLVFSRDATRRAATIVNQGTVPVWISGAQGVSETNGFYLPVGSGYVWTSAAPCFAKTQAGNATDGLLYVITEVGEAR